MNFYNILDIPWESAIINVSRLRKTAMKKGRMNAPSPVEKKQLDEVHIQIKEENK